MKDKLTILSLLIFLSFQIGAQENRQSVNVTAKLAAYIHNSAPEKTYLHTDKDLYIQGDTIWFKAYLLNGTTHAVSDKSKVVYVELWDSLGNLVVQQKLYADGIGTSGDIHIDDSIEEGDYYLRAYTMYMLNDGNPALFQKRISILVRPLPINSIPEDTIKGKEIEVKDTVPPPMKRPNVQFFPEGGNLVAGLQSGLGLKITDGTGNGIAVKGIITDRNGIEAARFETRDFGLGLVPFTPKVDMDYYAEIDFRGTPYQYRLPPALYQGYVVQLKNKDTQIMIKVSTNIGEGLKGTLLLGHLWGKAFLEYSKATEGKNSYTIKIPTSDLSDGVAHFTLFDQRGEPVCERLAFIENPKNRIDLTLKTDRSEYRPRTKAGIDLSLFDTHGKPLEGDFSINVSLDKGLERNVSDIKSWLLLNSDIGHTVEDPRYFFGEDSNKRRGLLDILMMAYGWRRFVLKSLPEDGNGKEMKYPINPPDVISLSEVVVQARKKTKKERIEEELNKMTLHGPARNRLFPDSIPGLRASSSVFDMISRVTGVQVMGPTVRIRGITSLTGGGDPLFTMDGVPVSPDFIQSMSITEVLFVDVLKGNEAAIYGARGTNGVIAIYTNRGQRFESTPQDYPDVTNFVVSGFHKAREFYSPNYSVHIPEHQLPDYRTTLYWNPEVVIDSGTPAKLNFYTGDVPGKYTAKVEGITTDGRLVSRQYSFYVSD